MTSDDDDTKFDVTARERGAENLFVVGPQDCSVASQTGSPTATRFFVLAFAFSMSVLLYLHRFSLTMTAFDMKRELGMSDGDVGRATAWFFYIYALAQVPAGRLGDLWGKRNTLALYVSLWSLAIMGMGLIQGLLGLICCRALLGLAQAGAYPCIASVNKTWFPTQQRGFANSVTTMGGRAGSLLNSLITTALMAALGTMLAWETGRWRVVLLLYGALGILWSVLYWLWYRETPREHSWCNDAEVRLISAGRQVPGDVKPRTNLAMQVVVAAILSPSIYFLCTISIFVNVGWIFLLTFFPRYLQSVHQISEQSAGNYSAFVLLASACGGVLGGLTTDFLVRTVGLKWGRRLPGMIASGGAACAYVGCFFTEDADLQIGLFAFAGFLIDFGLGALWAVFQDIAGKYVAAVLGFTNMCGNLAAGVFSQIIGQFADEMAWHKVFGFSAAALIITATSWLFVNPLKPIHVED